MVNCEENLIKAIARKIIGKEAEGIKDLLAKHPIDVKRFKECVSYHELIPFAYLALKDFDGLLPEDLSEFLKNNYYYTLIQCQKNWQEFLRISKAFEEKNIIMVPLKGIALLHDIYAAYPARPMTDIDLLVREEELENAGAALRDLGYRKELRGLKETYWRKSQCHIVFYKKIKEKKLPFVEVHWGIDFKRKNRSMFPELWGRIREINADGKSLKLLSPEDTLFSLALHNRRFGKVLCLKNVLDAAIILDKYSNSFDWDYCINMAHKYRMRAALFFMLSEVEFLAGINMPECALKGLSLQSPRKKRIKEFIAKNTFSWGQDRGNKGLYLKSHFLLYDNFWEPIDYILNIPQEQFAKFYGLTSYDKKTEFFYRNRLLFIFLRTIAGIIYRKA